MHDKNLINAYLAAKYVVAYQDASHRIQVGEHDLVIDNMLREKNARVAYFITPENPFSQNLTHEENELRHERFISALRQENLSYLEGYGTDEAETWEQEKSYLIFCNDDNDIHKLAVNFGQLGILRIERNTPVTLLVLSTIKYSPIPKIMS